MPTNTASVLLRNSETGARIAKDGLTELAAVGGPSTTLPSFRKMGVVKWRVLFGKIVMWLHNKQADINTAIYEDALKRESADRPPRWQ